MDIFKPSMLLLLVFIQAKSLVQFFGDPNFVGLFGEYDIRGKSCVNLQLPTQGLSPADRPRSIKTDHCIMIYDFTDCTGNSYKLNPGDYALLTDVKHDGFRSIGDAKFDQEILSFGKCESPQGLADAFVSLYWSYTDEHGSYIESLLNITNLCHRINISRAVLSWTNLIDNHGNCIVVHLENNESFKLEGGRSPLSVSINKYQAYFQSKLVGISSCNSSSPCISLNATVTRFSIISSKISTQAKSSDLSMAAESTFINNGWAIISQDYTASTTITEATETTLASSYSSMESFSVKAGVEYEESAGIPSVCSEKVKASLSAAYTNEHSNTKNQSNTRRHEIQTTFSVSQKIEIEPCTKYKVNSYLKVVKGYPLMYNVTVEVTGTNGGQIMTAQEIRDHLGSLDYNVDKDNTTVIASELGSILVDFGLKSVVDGEGEILPKCLNSSKKVDPRLYFLKMKPTFLTDKMM